MEVVAGDYPADYRLRPLGWDWAGIGLMIGLVLRVFQLPCFSTWSFRLPF